MSEMPPRPDASRPDEEGAQNEGLAWTGQAQAQTEEVPAPAPVRRHPVRKLVAGVVAGLMLVAAGIGIGWTVTGGSGSVTAFSSQPRQSIDAVAPANEPGGQINVKAVAAKVTPAVVDINTVLGGGLQGGLGQVTGRAAGTGMILTPSGEVLTNNHVIAGATSIKVTIEGKPGRYPAKVLGADPTDDVALIQIEGGVSGLPTVSLADSSSVAVGEQVVAIGNALGQGGPPTVSSGIVSAVGRSIAVGGSETGTEHLKNLIQTDAPISPGDSGGPLVNSAGQVIGMDTAAATGSPGEPASNIGYAISSNAALQVVNQIRAGDRSGGAIIGQPALLGVEVQSLTPQDAAQLGLHVSSGALVLGVVPGTPAARAGITQYSVITSVDGTAIDSAGALRPAIQRHAPGQSITVTWVNINGSHTSTVRLIAGPAV